MSFTFMLVQMIGSVSVTSNEKKKKNFKYVIVWYFTLICIYFNDLFTVWYFLANIINGYYYKWLFYFSYQYLFIIFYIHSDHSNYYMQFHMNLLMPTHLVLVMIVCVQKTFPLVIASNHPPIPCLKATRIVRFPMWQQTKCSFSTHLTSYNPVAIKEL